MVLPKHKGSLSPRFELPELWIEEDCCRFELRIPLSSPDPVRALEESKLGSPVTPANVLVSFRPEAMRDGPGEGLSLTDRKLNGTASAAKNNNYNKIRSFRVKLTFISVPGSVADGFSF